MKKKITVAIIAVSVIMMTALLMYLFREPFLRGIGNFLIKEDPLEKAEAIFVLGGDSYDRGNEALRLFNSGYSPKIICMGENVPTLFLALGLNYAESEVTKINIIKNNISENKNDRPANDSAVILLKKGTSTMEEMDAIVNYCLENRLHKIIILSSKFHTRRMNFILGKLTTDKIKVIISGAPSSIYSEQEWWKTEEGLIMVNNEYIKLLYYILKY